MKTLEKWKDVSVSHATLRPEDLIPAFVDALTNLMEDRTLLPGSDHPDQVRDQSYVQDRLGEIERRVEQGEAYYSSEDADWDLEWLFDTLDFRGPDGCSFGAHPGDGSDFGFWSNDSESV
jgi:hypothetical protein